MKSNLKIIHIFFLFLFSGIILLPTLNGYFHFIPERHGNENRAKHKKPEFDLSKLDAFVEDYDKYYTDNFSLRENAIILHNRFEFFKLGVSPVPDEVIIGKDGWFFDGDNIPNYTGKNYFSEKEMQQLKEELLFRTQWAKEHNINYYLAVVPSKMTVYPEFLPDRIVRESETNLYDQIMSLKNIPGINLIGLKENLLKNKNLGYPLYQKTDGHWNDLGAYCGYQTIMNRLEKDYPQLTTFPLNDFFIQEENKAGGRIVSMANIEKEYLESYPVLNEKNPVFAIDGKKRDYETPETLTKDDFQIIKTNEHGENLKILVFRDSFTLFLIRFFQEHFKESVFIHDEWKYRMREDLIEKEKPDIVICIMYENGIDKLIKYPFKSNL